MKKKNFLKDFFKDDRENEKALRSVQEIYSNHEN